MTKDKRQDSPRDVSGAEKSTETENAARAEKAARRWIALFFALFLGAMAIYMASNYIVDPTEYFAGYKDKELVNNDNYTREIKAVYVKRHREDFNAFVIGGSKAGVLDPERLSALSGLSWYNFYFDFGNFSDYYTFAKFLIETTDCKEILLHLSSFEVKYFSQADLADVYKVPAIASRNPFDIIPELLSSLLTDIKTLLKGFQRIQSGDRYDTEETYAVDVLKSGIRRLVRPEIRYARNPEPYTKRVTLLHYEANLKKLFQKEPAESYPAYELNLEALKKIRDLCKEHEVTLRVVIGASFLSERFDYECEKYYDYLRRLVKITDVWDFSDFSPYNLNPWNFSNYKHYRPSVGNLMIDTMYGVEASQNYQAFGQILNKENIDAYLLQRRASFAALKKQYQITGTVEPYGRDDISHIPDNYGMETPAAVTS